MMSQDTNTLPLSTLTLAIVPKFSVPTSPRVNCFLLLLLFSGAHLTILVDRTHLHRNIKALGEDFLSSTDIVERLRHHLSSVRYQPCVKSAQ